MTEISLLQPLVLRGIIEKFTAPETLDMLARTPRTPWPFPTAMWEVIKGSRAVAKPNVPNSEAHIVSQLGRSQESAAFIYLREKKVFQPTTLHWLRQAAENTSELAKVNAEAAVLREIRDLNTRFDNFAEYCIWQALTGTLVLDYPDVQATIDYKFPATHKPTVGTSWATATPAQIMADVKAWKRLIKRDGRVAPIEAWTTDTTVDRIFTSFAASGTTPGAMLSDRMKDEYFKTGTLPGFLGLNWKIQESVYDATDASYTAAGSSPGDETGFLADDALIMGNFTDNRPIELMEGPTADHSAPSGYTGKFSKTWLEEDPSDRQVLLEWNIMPILTRPEQIVSVASVV